MSAADGEVLGSTKILDNGPDEDRLVIALVAEGFRADAESDPADAEQQLFNDLCDQFLERMQKDRWFRGLLPGINVVRVNVTSTESGIDDPPDCSGATSDEDAQFKDTYFDGSLCNGWPVLIRRLSSCDWGLVGQVLDAEVPHWDRAVILVNSKEHFGAGFFTMGMSKTDIDDESWTHVALHELGHALGLADEYPYWVSCSADDDSHDQVGIGIEPFEPNVTRALTGLFLERADSRDEVKWGHLIHPDAVDFTAENPDCTQCPSTTMAVSPLPQADDIGLFEGAQYVKCGLFRPALRCRMRSNSQHFCIVCAVGMHATLHPFLPVGPHVLSNVMPDTSGDRILTLPVGCNGDGPSGEIRLLNLGGSFGRVEVSSLDPILSVAVARFGVPAGDLHNPDGLIPGEMWGVTATFDALTLDPSEDERTFSGRVQVEVDGAVAEVVEVQARVCRARARLRVLEVGSTGEQPAVLPAPYLLDFGQVATGLTMYRGLRLESDPQCCPQVLDVSFVAPGTPFGLAPNTPPSFTLLPGESAVLYVSFQAVAPSPIPVQSQLQLTTTDPANATVLVDLVAHSVAPPPVATVLAIDRSGSMSGETGEDGQRKIDHALQAADLFTSLLRPDDRVGLVRFNQNSSATEDLLVPLIQAGPETTGAGRVAMRDSLTDSADHLAPAGGTSIGAGMVTASDELDNADVPRRGLVVVTDGRENEGTTIEEARLVIDARNPSQSVYAIGLGLDQLSASLAEAASSQDGVAAITGELVGDREFLLQKLFVQVLSDLGGFSGVRDPVVEIGSGQTHSTEVLLGEVDLLVDFVVMIRPTSVHPKYTRVRLLAPNGRIITADNAAEVGAVFEQAAAHYLMRVSMPPFEDDLDGHLGPWQIEVTNEANPGQILFCALLARSYGDLDLGGRIHQSGTQAGATMELELRPRLFGVPATLQTPVEAMVQAPSGLQSVTLTRDAAGYYRGTVPDTQTAGIYLAEVEVGVLTPSGLPVTRSRILNGLILPPPKDGTPPDGGGKGGFLVAILVGAEWFADWLRRLFARWRRALQRSGR